MVKKTKQEEIGKRLGLLLGEGKIEDSLTEVYEVMEVLNKLNESEYFFAVG